MTKYIIITAFILYNVTWAMDRSETMDVVINALNGSMYRSINVNFQDHKSSDEKINQVIAIDENGKKILETYHNTRLTKKRFTMVNIFRSMRLQKSKL